MIGGQSRKKAIADLLPEGWMGLDDTDGTVITNGKMTIHCRKDGSMEVELDGKIRMRRGPGFEDLL